MKARILLAAALTAFWVSAQVGPALAGPPDAGTVQGFETTLRDTYADYRTALFATNTGDAAKSVKTLAAFADSWQALTVTYANAPPPQYLADPMWAETLSQVQVMIAEAQADVAVPDLAKAHEALEGVRAQIGGLHLRNGMLGFSDRMNAYHAEMEDVLGLDLATADAATLTGHAAVLRYLAKDIASYPPAEAAGNADYDALFAAFKASVDGFSAAVALGDMAAIKAAASVLKPAYSKFFVNFG